MSERQFFDAASTGDAETLKKLLDEGFEINTPNQEGKIALMYSVSNNHQNCTKILIEKGGNVNAIDATKWSVLHRTAFSKQSLSLTKLLLKHHANPSVRTVDGQSVLDFAIRFKNQKLKLLLVKHKLQLDEKDQEKVKQFQYKVKFIGI